MKTYDIYVKETITYQKLTIDADTEQQAKDHAENLIQCGYGRNPVSTYQIVAIENI